MNTTQINKKRKIKVAYFELFHCGFHEDYSINPKKYGGGPIFPRWAKEFWAKEDSDIEFTVFAPKGCWEHIDETEETKDCFHDLALDICEHLKKGVNIKNFIPKIDYYDVILHGHTGLAVNNSDCRPIQVHWSGFGRASDGHSFIPYSLVYGPDLSPFYNNQKVFPVIIGKPVPEEFVETKKEDFIFQCSRHDGGLDTIRVVDQCNENGVKGYFAGPINGDYPLLEHIDNKNTFYLGEISEQIKLEFSKRARVSTFFYPFGEVFNQSVVECLAHGTPIMRMKIERTNDPTFRNWLKEYIIEGKTGTVFTGNNFMECWEKSKEIDQKDCWESSQEYSSRKMVETFEEALKEIVKENSERLK